MNIQDYKKYMVWVKPKQSKYHNKKVIVDGMKFDSQKEYSRWCELQLLERSGKIKELHRQVKFELIPKQDGERSCSYIADFVYRENGMLIVEDAKGKNTEVYKIKKKLMLQRYGIKIKET